MEKILNQSLSTFEQYTAYNKMFFNWIAEEILKDQHLFIPFKSDKVPWKDFDLILKLTANSDEFWFIFKVISSDITTLELNKIIKERSQILEQNSSFFQNCKSFIFIFISDTDEYPIDLNIDEFKHSYRSQILTVNIFVNTMNGEFTSVRLPLRFKPNLEYLEN